MRMGPLRDLWADLVDKRLWPVALALVAALVAVPLVLGKAPSSPGPGGGGEPAGALAAPDSGSGDAPGGASVVALAATASGGAPLGGHAKDPFKQQFPAAKQASAGAAVPGASTGKAGGGSTSGGSGSGGGSTPSGGTPSAPPKTYAIAHVDVRFGRAAAPLKAIDDVPRLTPLPNAIDPVVVFLGMRSDQTTAVFLISSDVHPQGDGRCTPSVKTCTSVELKQGQTEILDVTGSDGSVTEYELDLDKVVVEQTTSPSKAHAALATKADIAVARADATP
jgi:hypothetical protein